MVRGRDDPKERDKHMPAKTLTTKGNHFFTIRVTEDPDSWERRLGYLISSSPNTSLLRRFDKRVSEIRMGYGDNRLGNFPS